MINIALSKDQHNYWLGNNKYHCMYSNEKFLEYFLNFTNNKLAISNKSNLIKIYGIQDAEENFDNKKLNIFLSVENCLFWDHYKHYNKYGDYGNNNISIYLYNHIDKFIKNEKYIAIPVIYTRIEYFKKYYEQIKPSVFTPFSQKKFCLLVSNHSGHEKCFKQRAITTRSGGILNNIGKVDHISIYKNKIGNSSCYHSNELLNLFNEYKFIFCFENSYKNGYITEKLFNAFFSRSIPIYIGPEDTNRYFNKDAYINGFNLDNKLYYNILKLNQDEDYYNNFINKIKINKDFDNEDFINISNKYFEEKIKDLSK